MGSFFNPNSWHLPWSSTKAEAPKPPQRPAHPQPAQPQNQQGCPAPPQVQNMFNMAQMALPAPFRQAAFSPTSQAFCAAKGEIPGQPPLAPGAKVLFNAILAYPDSKATRQEAYAIAKHTYDASRDFKVDPKLLLAIFAHESNGFDPDAKSPSGAGGIGQLTGSAINETRRLSNDPTYDGPGERQHYPRHDVRALLERPDVRATFQRIDQRQENRSNIHDNVWTSTAYARIMLDRSTDTNDKADINEMLSRYNAAGGAEQAAYPGKVKEAYSTLWHAKMPTTLMNP